MPALALDRAIAIRTHFLLCIDHGFGLKKGIKKPGDMAGFQCPGAAPLLVIRFIDKSFPNLPGTFVAVYAESESLNFHLIPADGRSGVVDRLNETASGDSFDSIKAYRRSNVGIAMSRLNAKTIHKSLRVKGWDGR